jgi:acyl-CoA thioesterase II
MTGTFIVGGRLDVPYVYTVRHVRDGFMYCTRAVDARQDGKICFSCLCSFKRDENEKTFHHQPPAAQGRFREILSGKRPEDQPISPSVDADWWIEAVKQGNVEEREFPGLDVRKVDMKDYNQSKLIQDRPEKYRQLTQYCLKGSPDEDPNATLAQIKEREAEGEYDNLYACAHMYSSDRNSLLLIPRALGIKYWTEMASLTLTVIIHQHGQALRMINWDATRGDHLADVAMKWFIQEGWTPQSAENRAVHESHLWSPDGTLIATSLQDSMLRLRKLGRTGNL